MKMDVLASMSLAGSIATVIYFAIRPAAVKYSNSSWRYCLLKLALFFFIVPVQAGKDIYRNIYLYFLPDSGGEEKYLLNAGKVIYIYRNGNLTLSLSKAAIALQVVFAVITVVLFIVGAKKYFRNRAELIICSKATADADVLTLARGIREELRIKRNVRIRISGTVMVPLTFGVFSPYILIPEGLLEEGHSDELAMVIRHELIHVKNNDTFVRLLGMAALALNWYNPLIYFVLREISTLGENVCDEKIVMSMSKEERQRYGTMILDMICCESARVSLFAVSFSNKRKRVKERIELMLNVKRNKRIFQLLSAGVIMAAGVMSSMTVFAYDEPRIVKNEVEETAENINDQTEGIFLTDGGEGFVARSEEVAVDDELLEYADCFVDNEGNVYSKAEISNSRIGCTHTMKSGTYYQHTPQGEGCIMKVYDADICSKCQYLILHSLKSTHTYAKCPH